MERHLASKCKMYIQPKATKTYRCAFDGCKRANLHELRCSECKRNYCIEHRHDFSHLNRDKIDKEGLRKSLCALV